MKYPAFIMVLCVVLTLGLAACGDATQPAPAAPTSGATTIIAPTTNQATTVAVATTSPASKPPTTPTVAPATIAPVANTSAAITSSVASGQPDTGRGLVIFRQQGCAGCHGGDKATGALGPALNNITFPQEGLLRQVRGGAAPMPAFPADQLPDADVKLIYAYLISLKGK